MFEMEFMRNAFFAVLVISPLFGLLSTLVVANKMSFFSDALGHSAFTGMALGAVVGLMEPRWCAVVFAVFFAVLFSFVRRKSSASSDTVIGVFSSTAVALGIFIATLGGRSFTKFNTYLVGDILSVTKGEIFLLLAVLAAVVALWCLCSGKLLLSSIHPELSGSRGVRTFALGTLFSASVAVVVTLSLSWVGLLVINSLLVLPAGSARNISSNFRGYTLISILGALASGILGLFASYRLGVSSGAAISLVLAIWFAITFIFRKR